MKSAGRICSDMSLSSPVCVVSPSSRVSSLVLFTFLLILSSAAVDHFSGGRFGIGLVVARNNSSASFSSKIALSSSVIVPLKTLSLNAFVPSAPSATCIDPLSPWGVSSALEKCLIFLFIRSLCIVSLSV